MVAGVESRSRRPGARLVAGIDSSTQATKVAVREAEAGALVGEDRAPHSAGTEHLHDRRTCQAAHQTPIPPGWSPLGSKPGAVMWQMEVAIWPSQPANL